MTRLSGEMDERGEETRESRGGGDERRRRGEETKRKEGRKRGTERVRKLGGDKRRGDISGGNKETIKEEREGNK